MKQETKDYLLLVLACIVLVLFTKNVKGQNLMVGMGISNNYENVHGDYFQQGYGVSVDMGWMVNDNDKVFLTGSINLWQNEPTPQQYSFSGNTFGDAASGTYKDKTAYNIGMGIKVFEKDGISIYGFSEISYLDNRSYNVYRDPMGILGGKDSRYITLKGNREESMTLQGGLMFTNGIYYCRTSISLNSFIFGAGIHLGQSSRFDNSKFK